MNVIISLLTLRRDSASLLLQPAASRMSPDMMPPFESSGVTLLCSSSSFIACRWYHSDTWNKHFFDSMWSCHESSKDINLYKRKLMDIPCCALTSVHVSLVMIWKTKSQCRRPSVKPYLVNFSRIAVDVSEQKRNFCVTRCHSCNFSQLQLSLSPEFQRIPALRSPL